VSERIVYVVSRPPLPLPTGGRIRLHRLLMGLADVFDTTLVTYVHAPGSLDGHASPDELRAALPGVAVVTVPGMGPASRPAMIRSAASWRSWELGRYPVGRLARAVREAARERGAALVHFGDVASAAGGPVPGIPSVLAADGVHRALRGFALHYRGARRVFAELEWRKVRREELAVWRGVSLAMAVSPLEAREMRARGVPRVGVCPNGTDPVDFLGARVRQPDEPLRILFVGLASYPPNERGLAWFVRQVLPLVKKHLPVRFDVVGSPPYRPVEDPAVSYVGVVPDVGPWYERCHLAVVPLLEGVGTRLKIVEAMAQGRLVVSTRVGAEGLPVTPGVHYLEADEPEAFADAVLRAAAAGEDAGLEKMREAAREAVEPLFWPTIVGGLVDLYRDEIERGRRQ
jgi:glycosyltransferase involved in cell wall biosynthesis